MTRFFLIGFGFIDAGLVYQKHAFDLGCSQIDLSNLKERHKPKLLTPHIDPTQLILTEAVAPLSSRDTIQAEIADGARNINVGKDISSVSIDNIIGGIHSSIIVGGNVYTNGGSGSSFSGSTSEQERLNRLNELKRLSRARCIERWQAVGLSRTEAINFADDPTTDLLQSQYEANSEKPLVVLVAELGTGKSLIIDKLFQKAIDNVVANTDAPIPIYLEASECVRGFREKIISDGQILGNIEKQGIAVFVDGVDGVGLQLAQRILQDARIAVDSWPKATITLASRPLYVFNNIEEVVKVLPMSEAEARRLISQIIGQENTWSRSWPKSIQDAVHRPLFALLLGTYLREAEHRAPRSTGELITDLVERSLRRENVNITNTNRLLEKLAALCIDRSGTKILKNEVASNEEIQLLIESRLVVENSGVVGFALPILTEWFAAQSLSHGYPSLAQLLGDEQNLEKWRYPLIIFAAIFNHEQVSTLLAPLCERFPAFTSEILDKSINRWEEAEYDTVCSESEYGSQIRTTMQTWVKGIGSLAKLIAPINEDNSLLPLGVVQDDRYVTFGWYNGQDKLPEISSLSGKSVIDSIVDPNVKTRNG